MLPRLSFSLLVILAAGLHAANSPAPVTFGLPPEVRPTVTVESGDTGGKFFGAVPDPAKSRHYFIAAESVLWDFAPSGRDDVCGLPLPPALVRERKAGKVRYVQYTDATFTAKVLPNRSLGIMGPALRGVVGEFLVVTFLNRTDQPLSMHPHGVRYDKDSEGALTLGSPGRGAAVGPGARFTYVWHLDEASGPRPDEPSSKGWLYHSHISGDADVNVGLIGPIIVTDPARARPDGMPRDIDREFATLYMIFNESGLDAAAIEAAEYAGLPGLTSAAPPLTWAETQQALELGARSSINGFVFGNLPGLQMNEGERTRWYVFGLGSERDFHTAHWHGLRVLEEGRRRTDVIEVLPGSMKVADAIADNPGSWLLHCHVAEHMREGMFAQVTVHARDTIGVSRAPADAFLGYPAEGGSLRIARVPAQPELRGAVRLQGSVTVFDAFGVFNEPVTLRVGPREFAFRPDKAGVATVEGATIRITNANEFGMVYGGVLQFEVSLPAGFAENVNANGTVRVELDIARARHVAAVEIRAEANAAREGAPREARRSAP